LGHRALVGLPVDFIQKEVAHAFVDELRDLELKQRFLMGGDRSLKEALNQNFELEAVEAAAGRPASLREVTTTLKGKRPLPTEPSRDGQPACWQCGRLVS
jgi:hypothetical protein